MNHNYSDFIPGFPDRQTVTCQDCGGEMYLPENSHRPHRGPCAGFAGAVETAVGYFNNIMSWHFQSLHVDKVGADMILRWDSTIVLIRTTHGEIKIPFHRSPVTNLIRKTYFEFAAEREAARLEK